MRPTDDEIDAAIDAFIKYSGTTFNNRSSAIFALGHLLEDYMQLMQHALEELKRYQWQPIETAPKYRKRVVPDKKKKEDKEQCRKTPKKPR